MEATDTTAPTGERETYAFGRHRLDVTARRLTTIDGGEVPLAPRCFDLLVALARRADRAVPRDELLDAVWGETIVEEGNLAWTVKELRRALGDDAGALETVRGFGYRFRLGAEERADSAVQDQPPRDASVPRSRRSSAGWGAIAALLVAVAAGGWWVLAPREPAEFDGGAHERLALEAWERGAELLALDHARRGLGLARPGSPERRRLAVRVAMWSGDWAAARQALDGLEDLDRRDLEVALWRPRILALVGEAELAERELSRLRTLPEPLGVDPRLDLEAASLALRAGDPAAARMAAELAAVTGARRGGIDVELAAQLLVVEAATALGDFEPAARLCGPALEQARAGGMVRLELEGVRVCARLALVRGELDRAVALCDEGLQLARNRGTRSAVAALLVVRASVALIRGELGEATAGAFEALGAARDAAAVDDEAAALRLLSLTARLGADLDAAERWAREGLERAEQFPHASRLALLNGELGRVLLERGDYGQAQRSFEAAARAEVIPTEASRALAQISLGWCRLGMGEPQAARALGEGVLQRLSGPLDGIQIEAWSLIAEAAAEEGNADVAAQAAVRLAQVPRHHPPQDAGWRLALARALAASGKRDGALAELDALLTEPTLQRVALVRFEAALRRAAIVGDRSAQLVAEQELRAHGIGRLARGGSAATE